MTDRSKTIRIIKRERNRIAKWQKFMKMFKFHKPNSVPVKVMNESMNWS